MSIRKATVKFLNVKAKEVAGSEVKKAEKALKETEKTQNARIAESEAPVNEAIKATNAAKKEYERLLAISTEMQTKHEKLVNNAKTKITEAKAFLKATQQNNSMRIGVSKAMTSLATLLK